MTSIERVLDEHAEDFAEGLTDVGFSDVEARRFVEEAGPALVRSYRWHAASTGVLPATRDDAREVLGGMPGRALAHKMGLPEQKAWDGLRHLVPAVLRASGGIGPGLRPSGGRSRGLASRADEAARFEVGFGLTLRAGRENAGDDSLADEPTSKRSGVLHPIFARLLSLQD